MPKKHDPIHTVYRVRTFYVLIFSENRFFVHHTTQQYLRNVYKDHYTLKWNWTKKQMAEDKEKGYIPQMFILEEDIECTKAMAFSRVVAWCRVLRDAGYVCTNGDTVVSYLDDLVPKTQKIYEEIKDADLEMLLDEDMSLFPNYGARNRPKPEPVHYNTVKVKFTDRELKMLELATMIYDFETVADLVRDNVVQSFPDMMGEFYIPE